GARRTVEADGVGGVGDDLGGDLAALGRIVDVLAHGGHEGGVLQRHDGGVGDGAAEELAGLVGGAGLQRVLDGQAVEEQRADGGGAEHVAAVGGRFLDDAGRQADRRRGRRRGWRRRRRRLGGAGGDDGQR